MAKKRVLVCEFHQESNTFNPIVMPLDWFNAGGETEGESVFQRRKADPCAVHGIVDVLEENGAEVIPSVFISAISGGRVADSVLDYMKERLEYYIRAAGELDGVCAVLHGATCTESSDDACGDLLCFLRGLVGDKPIAVTCDLHAKVTDRMLQYADFVCGYQTYPHVDYYNVGRRAAALCMRKLCGQESYVAAVAIPMLIPPAGYTNLEGPMRDLINSGHAMVNSGELLDFSIFAVQPWLDVDTIASRVIAVAADPETAKQKAQLLAQGLFDLRDAVQPPMLSVDEIIDIAEANKEDKPVILADSADSPNGGAVGDSPVVAMRLLERGSKLRAGMFVKDPEAVKQAFALGVGGIGEFSVGAGYTMGMPGPLKAVGTVRSLHDGFFRLEGPAGRGEPASIGSAAVVSFGNVDILISEETASSGDPQLLRHFGIEPGLYDLIVVKANTSFRVPYGKISDLIYVADTPGAGASNLKQLQWRNLPKGMYPFDLPDNFVVEKAKLW